MASFGFTRSGSASRCHIGAGLVSARASHSFQPRASIFMATASPSLLFRTASSGLLAVL